jgi:LysM repeat protein
MEERVQMTQLMRQALTAASLATLLWLAGCATAPGTNDAASGALPAPTATPSVATTPTPSVIPRGPLSPITAAEANSRNVAALLPPADLWDRIRRGYAMPNLDVDLVRRQEQWYASRPDYIQRMTDRSRKYLFHIVEELERRNMPSELALLPFIESAFNPQAVKNIVANPESFRAELPVIENHPYFQTVVVGRDMDVELAAKLADIKLEDFKALNPQLNRPVILAAGTPQILLPWDNATVFQRNFAAYTTGQFSNWTAWSVPATMSVNEAARRVGMSEGELRTVNTIPPRMLIKAGSVLVVPRTPKMQDDVASHLADNGQLSLAPEITTRRTTVKAGRNESVASIARRYRVSAGQVAEWNDVSATSAFKLGQQVVLHLPARAAPRARVQAGGPRSSQGAPTARSAKSVVRAPARPTVQRTKRR